VLRLAVARAELNLWYSHITSLRHLYPKTGLNKSDAEYLTNLVNINVCGCKQPTVQFLTLVAYAIPAVMQL